MSEQKRLGFLALLVGLSLSACSMAPLYERPAAPVAPAWNTGIAEGQSAAQLPWRDFFTDPVLQALIADALANNRDLRTALLQVEEARAQYGIQRADRLPHLEVQASDTRGRTPADLSATGVSTVSEQAKAGLAIPSFELDLFGRVKSLSDAALAQFQATEYAHRAAQITLVGEVARAYLQERSLSARLALARETLRAREESLSLIRQRFEAEVASALDLKQAEAQYFQAEVDSNVLERQHAQAMNALGVLVGKPLPALPIPAHATEPLQVVKSLTLPAGLPSVVLTQRPDILEAEEKLKAANANIGAARAAFFPQISLTASGGSASPELSGLFENGSRSWSFIPSLSLPIFEGGKNQANLDLANVRKDMAVAAYEKAIQQAFQEVDDALTATGILEREYQAQAKLAEAQGQRLHLARLRYDQGVAGYLDVLDAEREYFSAQQNRLDSERARIANAVTLFQALGGGFADSAGKGAGTAVDKTAQASP